MASDMVVALREASAHGATLFGLNCHAPHDQRHLVARFDPQLHEPGEVISLDGLKVPQVRHACAVLGLQPAGQWGFTHGVNEHRVAIGITQWNSRLPVSPASSSLDGLALVRLVLERSHGALQAVEVLSDLLQRHCLSDSQIFLIADAREAFVMEACGRHWALLECGHTRAVTDAAMIRQDWRRLSPGLATCVTEQNWWQDDGSKLDFVRCLASPDDSNRNAQKRWGRASLALAQQQGAIDLHYLRRMLADHYHENRALLPSTMTLASNFLVELGDATVPTLAWVAFGSPQVALHFPLCLIGAMPSAFTSGPASSVERRLLELQALPSNRLHGDLHGAIERLQTRFDQDADDFLAKAKRLQGMQFRLDLLATEMMRSHVELFNEEFRQLTGAEGRGPHRMVKTEELFYIA